MRFLLLILICSFSFPGKGQSRFRFYTLGPGQGITAPFIWSICQDKNGFMWLGSSSGLNRYDGHTIKQYFNDPRDSFSIPSNTVFWIYRDREGDMWFACGAKGVVRYNYEKDRFEKFMPYEEMKKKTKLSAPVWRIGEDAKGSIYLACGGACFRYTKSLNKLENLTPLFKGEIDNYGVAMFIHKGNDSLWILTDNGIFLHDVNKNTILKIPFDKEKYGYGLAAMHDGEFINDSEILISMGRPGFVILNTYTLAFAHAPPPFDPGPAKKYSETGGVLKDTKGRVWLVNSVYGLIEYNPATRKFYSMKNEPSYPYPYAEQEGKGMNIYEDRDGNIWYGTSRQGVIWFQPRFDFIKIYQRNYAEKNSLPDNYVSSFLQVPGQMLIGTSKGLTSFDTTNNTFKTFPYSLDHAGNYPYFQVRTLGRSGDNIYISTGYGFSVLDYPKRSFKRFIHTGDSSAALPENNVWFVEETAPTEVIVSGGYTVSRLDMQSGFNSKQLKADDPLHRFTDVNYVLRDGNKIWFESGQAELYEYDINSRSILRHSYTLDSAIKMIIVIQKEGNKLILGLYNGFIVYDLVSKKSTRYSLPTVSQEVMNVICYGKDKLWLTTQTDIIKYDLATKKAEAFDLSVLLPHANINRRAFYLDANANLWIGTTLGFCIVDTKRFRAGNSISAPRIVDFSVFDKRKVFNRTIEELDKISLNYDENFFSMDFSAFNYGQAAAIKYMYRLEGFDKDWQYSEKNSASYTNVPPGTYTLLVKAQSAQGQVIDATPVTIKVNPPFWKTTWFFILGSLLLLGIVYWFIRQLKWRRQKKAVEKTIDYFANSVYGENSVDEICWDIARNCISEFDFEDCVVYLKDDQSGRMVQRAAFGAKNPKGHEIVNPLEIEEGRGIVGTVTQTGKPLLISDTSKDGRYIVDDMPRASELAVPILHDGKVIGVIDSENSRKNFFTFHHLKAITIIASISANKIAEAQAESYARDNEIKLLEINKLLAESQLMALRAQMNPHFVFNCLNSIQECIVTEKYGEASRYLNKFSKLFRMVLNNSGKNLVTLNEETEVLGLYLELEQMRFEKSFTYNMIVDEELEADDLLIPSMLLQPYVENALWHGLMHKQGERILLIEFRRVNEDIFKCIIDDNGIGRKKSYELKAQQSKTRQHESKGLKISKDRLDVLQRQGYHATVEIIDKESGGTTVVLELSSFFKN